MTEQNATSELDDRDPNVLARLIADLTDEMEALRREYIETQKRWLTERARLELAAGTSVEMIPDHLWEDGPRVAQMALDRVWDEGYRDAMRSVAKWADQAARRGGLDDR